MSGEIGSIIFSKTKLPTCSLWNRFWLFSCPSTFSRLHKFASTCEGNQHLPSPEPIWQCNLHSLWLAWWTSRRDLRLLVFLHVATSSKQKMVKPRLPFFLNGYNNHMSFMNRTNPQSISICIRNFSSNYILLRPPLSQEKALAWKNDSQFSNEMIEKSFTIYGKALACRENTNGTFIRRVLGILPFDLVYRLRFQTAHGSLCNAFSPLQ